MKNEIAILEGIKEVFRDFERAERTVGVIRALSRAALIEKNLDYTFWPYAVAYAVYIKNRCVHLRTKKYP